MADPDPIIEELADAAVRIDAPLPDKAFWEHGRSSEIDRPPPIIEDADIDDDSLGGQPPPQPTVGARVRGPGAAAVVGAGSRRARKAADVGGVDAGAKHNWIPCGPRNVGGRVTALAIHPTDPSIMYAGPAAGGVFKSLDGGESWFPLFHDEPSLSIGAIDICRDHPDVVWVATGEGNTTAESILGNGVYRSADAGQTWTTAPDAPAGGLVNLRDQNFEAIAAHPTNDQICWVVGSNGAARTTNGGQGWHVFAESMTYTDVAFSQDAGGAATLFLVPGYQIAHRAFLVRLDAPDEPNLATVDGLLPAGADPVPAVRTSLPAHPQAANPPDPARAKIAVSPSNRQVAYLRITTAEVNGRRGHYGVYRVTNAQTGAANALAFRRLADHPDFATETQGEFNLSLAVSPDNENHIATAMVEIYVHRTAAAAAAAGTNGWIRAQNRFAYPLDRAQHADHHCAVIAHQPAGPLGGGAGAPLALWDGNDGGLSRSVDWQTATGYAAGENVDPPIPLPPGTISWRKHSDGMNATLMYDVTQSPLVPSMFGCGFQDNGVYIATGGPSWQLVLIADGGYVAFDPDDPYRAVVSYHEGVTEARFPGLIRGTLGAVSEGIQDTIWPRELRNGFLLPVDRPLFTANTAIHPTQPGRLLHARRNRLYATHPTTGDQWQTELVGNGVEILYASTVANAAQAILSVQPTPAAMKLGLLPQRERVTADDGRPLTARVRTLTSPPYSFTAGDELRFVRDAEAAPVTIPLTASAEMPNPASATVGQLSRHIAARSGGRLRALPVFSRAANGVALMTRESGAAHRITLGGTADTVIGHNNRGYAGADAAGAAPALPALVLLDATDLDLTGKTLTIDIDGRGVRTITFDTDVPHPASVSSYDLARAIRTALAPDADHVTVANHSLNFGVRFSATAAGVTVRLDRTAVDRLTMFPDRTGASIVTNQGTTFVLMAAGAGASLQLRIRDAATGGRTVTFNAALGLGDLTAVMPTELIRVIRTTLAGSGLQVRVDLDVFPRHDTTWGWSSEGGVTEIVFSAAHPDHAWVGDETGRVYRGGAAGSDWTALPDGPFTEARGAVQAIAVHPVNEETVYVGTYSEIPVAAEPGFLYRTDDNGSNWRHIGADLKDATGKLVGVRAVELDPDHPDTMWAATDVGVWRSTDAGDHWQPFNEGLPNCRVVDLTFEPATRTLRCGAWGRGVFERHVGDRPPKDVVLALRANAVDPGGVRPALAGPDALALTPTAALDSASPDIMNRRALPATGFLIDGSELDALDGEDAVPGATNVLVQVHNRGSFPTTGVQVIALWAFADAGPPDFPDGFWSDLFGGAGLAVGTTKGAWTVLGTAKLGDPPSPPTAKHDTLAPGDPRVVRFDHTWPDTLRDHARVGIVAVVTSPDDPFDPASPLAVDDLLRLEPKAAYRELRAVPVDEDTHLVLRPTGAPGIRTVAPGAGFQAAAALGLPNTGPVAEIQAANAEPFALAVGGAANPRAIRVQVNQTVTVTFDANEPLIANIAHANSEEVAAVVNRTLVTMNLPARALSARTRRRSATRCSCGAGAEPA